LKLDDGTCDTPATGTTVSHTYDSADRITDSGVGYDTFGRITTVPAAAAGTTSDITASYYTSDMVRALTEAGTTHTWTLDPNGRLRGRTDSGGATGSRTNHYADDTDSPSWVAEDATASHWTRNISAFGSDLAAVQDSAAGTTLQLANLHGDTVATASLSPTATGLLSTFEATEFGIPRTTPSPRYGWLGAKQRETDDLTGIMLMGVRLYVPAMGRFLQVDPVPGGSANDYDYANQDPINAFDLNGEWWGWRRTLRVGAWVGGFAGALACGASIVCGALVGAAAAAASYSASYAGTRRWRWRRFAVHTAVGAGLGALEAWGAGRAANSRWLRRTHRFRRWRWRVHFDRQPHRFRWIGRRSHWQLNVWRHGVRGSGRSLRFPVWRRF